ncbi:toxin Cry1Ac domain D-VI-related protein, partial [Enterococcus faecium]|uniref:toxin Cry1Ac domain D-VI-related protein n=1 Tax=Enterococcus faecium TaxID=1352 RepID=UPI0023B2C968
EEAVKSLFSDETNSELASGLDQKKINNAQDLLNKVNNGTKKAELQKLIDLANKLLKLIRGTINIYTTPRPTNNLSAGISMGNGHDRQDFGIQLEKGTNIKVKQLNPNYNENLRLRLLADSSDKESSIEFNKTEVILEAKSLVVPFIDTPYDQMNDEKPIVEFSIEGSAKNLPIFTKETNMEQFKSHWNLFSGFALIKGDKFQTLLPNRDKSKAIEKNLLEVIDIYDNKIISYYNDLIGLSNNDSNLMHRSSERKYFYKADAKGPGYMYYGGEWAGQSDLTAFEYLSDGWGALHETGHGYEGSFMNRGLETSEVWNNLYGVMYEYKHKGKEIADKSGWLYDYGGKNRFEVSLKNDLFNKKTYNSLGLREKLIILSNILDKAGDKGMSNFYRNYRELAKNPEFKAEDYLLPDLLTTYWGEPNKYDFSPVFYSWGVTITPSVAKQVKDKSYSTVAHLAQVVPDDKMNEAIEKLTDDNRLSSVLSLVTNQEIQTLNLQSNITIKLKNPETFKEIGAVLKIYDGNSLYKEIPITEDTVTLKNMPNGVYSLDIGNSGYTESPYLFVKDSKEEVINLLNYEEVAESKVNSLLEDIGTEKVKSDVMQKDFDEVKQVIEALVPGEKKSQLEKKLNSIFESLQEVTLRGLGDWNFATMNVNSGVATIRTFAGEPHVYFSDTYASIQVIRKNETIYEREYNGNKKYDTSVKKITLEDGDTINIFHQEKDRYRVNHASLKSNNQTINLFSYIVNNGQIMLIENYFVKIQEKIDNLFSNESQTKLASGVTQNNIDEVKQLLDILSEETKKKELLELINKAQQLLNIDEITSIAPYNEGVSTFVTGTYSGKNVAFMRVEVNGEKKPLIRPTTPGSFSYYIRGLKTTDTVEYVLFDASYKEIARQTVTVSSGTSVAITNIDQYIEGTSSYVTGTYTGNNVAFMRVEVNGEKKPLIRPTTPGVFSYYVRGLKTTDIVEYVLFNASYKEIARQTVVVRQ